MASPASDPRSLEDKLVGLALVATWPVYLVGGLYVLGPVLGVVLVAILASRCYFAPVDETQPSVPRIPVSAWIWILGMVGMLIALWVGHASEGLSTGQTVKSTIGWAKGWALFVFFTLAGACLDIRVETVIRAASITALISLVLTPFLYLAPMIGLPEILYISPLQAIGGPGPEFFAIQLYSMDPGDGLPRWRYFMPWSPAAGLVANVYLLLAIEDRRKFWRIVGIVSALTIILLSKSRLGLLTAVIVWPTAYLVSRISSPGLWLASVLPAFLVMLFSQPILSWVDQSYQAFRGMRAGSTRVREALGRIAIERWETEAPLFGHGIVERGPHYVEYMPIGSHHTWFGLLYVKGALGAVSLAIPLIWTLIESAILAMVDPLGRLCFAITLLLILFTVGENLEILTYLIWPALVVLGIGMRRAADKRQDQGG
jgi:hypothetical protein